MTANDHAARIATLRQEAQDVLERHVRLSQGMAFPDEYCCGRCVTDWPCDAHTQARRVLVLLDAVERVIQERLDATTVPALALDALETALEQEAK